jgi:trehalose 6-phosphate phosphatase
MRTEGTIAVAIGIAVASGEVAPAVREAADLEVAGPPGALGVLRHLLGD